MTDTHPFGSPRRVIIICMALFLFQPVQFGIWLSRISEIQGLLGLSKSSLAFALLGMPCGLLPTLFLAGRTIDRTGPRRALLCAFPLMLAAGLLPGLASGPMTLFGALLLLGASFAFTEVGLNVFAAQTEKALGVNIMSRSHGFWSLGVMTGSLAGVYMASLGIAAFGALFVAAICLLPILTFISFKLVTYPKAQQPEETSKVHKGLPIGLIPITLVVFGATITEGAMSDWAVVYMSEASWGGTAKDGLAVSVFAAMVTIARFLGDWLKQKYGASGLARMSICVAVFGLVLLVFSNAMWLSLIGFGCVGFGVSLIFPMGVSASANIGDGNEARNVSLMTFGALSGFLIGPPMIGLFADVFSLSLAFALLIPALLCSIALSHHLDGKEPKG